MLNISNYVEGGIDRVTLTIGENQEEKVFDVTTERNFSIEADGMGKYLVLVAFRGNQEVARIEELVQDPDLNLFSSVAVRNATGG